MKTIKLTMLMTLLVSTALAQAPRHQQNTSDWRFAVSGDSRNCGDVVVPSIAAGATKNKATFYWHLGDLRAIYGIDEDYQNSPEHRGKVLRKDDYLKDAWDDFIQNQISAFGSMPVFVGIGNHETTPPKTREQFADKFAQWLDSAPLKKQRLADDPKATTATTYFHWIQGSVDFIYLDNATLDQFSPAQVTWLEGVLGRASSNPEVRSLVVGMHAALPDSVAIGHSMSDWPVGVESGRRVYTDLLDFKKKTEKNVYLLASHSHFFMSGIFNSEYWAAHGVNCQVGSSGPPAPCAMRCPPPRLAQKKPAPKSMATCWEQCITMEKLISNFKRSRSLTLPLPSASAIRRNLWISVSTKTRLSQAAEPPHK